MTITAMETLELGPILGIEDQDTLKVWVRTREEPELWLRFAKAPVDARWKGRGFEAPVGQQQFKKVKLTVLSVENGYYTAQAKVKPPERGARYFYEVVSADEMTGHPKTFCNANPPSFRSLPIDPAKLQFAFMSCHSTEKTPRGRPPAAVWQIAVNRLIAQERASFAIFGGDQIYADGVQADVRKHRLRHPQDEYGYDEAYADTYRDQWSWPEVRLFMAHMPCVMMWDDHDIINGWGSRGDEHKLPSELFSAATSAFERHQHVHNPSELRGKDHRAFALSVGSTAFLVLDGRSKRNTSSEDVASRCAVLGQAQWDDLKVWLDGKSDLSHLVVVTAIPLAFLPAWFTRRKLIGEFVSDLVDQWSSPPNQSEQLRLVGTLFEFRKRTGANVVLLGGDVHAAATATIHSEDQRYLHGSEQRAKLFQVVSSGISHTPTFGALYLPIGKGYNLRDNIAVSFDPVFHSRSFAELTLQAEDRRCHCAIFLEEEDAAISYDWPGPA